MSLPYKSLWDTLSKYHTNPTVFYHKSPQVWASYLSLYALASEGGHHLFIAKGYEKEAFYRAAKKWLETVGLEKFIDKDGINLGSWGSLNIIYPISSFRMVSGAKSCLVASPYLFKRDYFEFLKESLPPETPLWIFHSQILPEKKGNSARPNQVYKRFFWHTDLDRIALPARESLSYDCWIFTQAWENLLYSFAETWEI